MRGVQLSQEPEATSQHTASRRAVLSGASLLAGGILVGGIGAPALGSGSRLGDAEILNFALEMEELQAALYAQALQHAGLTGELAQYARVVGAHERAHVAFLRETLGSRAKPAPAFDFGDAVTNSDRFAVDRAHARGSRCRRARRPGREPDQALARLGRDDRLGRGPPRRLDPRSAGRAARAVGVEPGRRRRRRCGAAIRRTGFVKGTA